MSQTRNKPTALVVLGIINLALGVLGTCGGLVGVAGEWMPTEKALDLPADVQRWLKILQGASLALSLLLAAGGIGLLLVRPWGRWLSLLYAVLYIPVSLAYTWLTTSAIKPLIEQQAQGQVPPEVVQGIFFGAVVLSICCGLIYPLVLIVVLNLKAVRAAFRQQPVAPPPQGASPSGA